MALAEVKNAQISDGPSGKHLFLSFEDDNSYVKEVEFRTDQGKFNGRIVGLEKIVAQEYTRHEARGYRFKLIMTIPNPSPNGGFPTEVTIEGDYFPHHRTGSLSVTKVVEEKGRGWWIYRD